MVIINSKLFAECALQVKRPSPNQYLPYKTCFPKSVEQPTLICTRASSARLSAHAHIHIQSQIHTYIHTHARMHKYAYMHQRWGLWVINKLQSSVPQYSCSWFCGLSRNTLIVPSLEAVLTGSWWLRIELRTGLWGFDLGKKYRYFNCVRDRKSVV